MVLSQIFGGREFEIHPVGAFLCEKQALLECTKILSVVVAH